MEDRGSQTRHELDYRASLAWPDELEDWYPMPLEKGPPLPNWLGITWPWYKPPAEFEISDLVISPEEVQVGQPVVISCMVTNISETTGDYTVKLRGDFMGEQAVELEPGEYITVSFEAVPAAVKTYSISVDGLSGSFKATEVGVADIRLENLIITPSEVEVGKKVIISCIATNYGNAVGQKTITCTVS